MKETLIDPKVGLGNKAVKTREEVPSDLERTKSANNWLERAGQALKPSGGEYMGSAAVHYYKFYEFEGAVKHATIQQVLVSRVDEGLADYGLKELLRALMKTFGRKVKE